MRYFCRFEKNSTLALFILLLCLWNSSHSMATDSPDKDAEVKGGLMGFSFLPFALYTPETELGGGVGGIKTFRFGELGPQSRPSSVSLSAKYTQNKQYVIDLTPELYLKREMYHLKSNILYQEFPFKFYGIGNDTSDDMEEDYTPKEVKIWVTFQRKIHTYLRLGVQYNFEDVDILEVEKGKLLAGENIRGRDGGRSSGVGLLLDWDTRDRIFSATSGGFHQASFVTYKDALGSDYDFTRYGLDLRRYLSILPSHTLALQGFSEFSTGEPPFQKLALLGGRFRMRGYYEGKFRDKNMIALQVEYRITPVWWRGGIVGFLGFGDVSDKVSNFKLEEFKTAGGIGFRFQFDRGEGVNLRADFAYGEDGILYYLTMFEAF